MPSVGKDLAAIRKHLGFSIDDIQQSTRIPVDTLKSIENGTIFNNKDENTTYIRSFVRSYGRAMKLDDDVVVKALDQQELNNYNHLLLKNFPELTGEKIVSDLQGAIQTEEEEKPEPEKPKDTFDDIDKAEDETSQPKTRSVNWAAIGQQFEPSNKQTPVWLIGTILILVILFASAYGVYRFGLFSSDDVDITPEQPTEQPAQTGEAGTDLSLELTDEPPAVTEAEELDEILFLTVYAAFDKLEPVRVWSDEKPRMDPYWMDQGIAFNFEFRDSVRVRGQYSRMLLFLNGHQIENFRTNYFNDEENAVELTRSMFEEDPKWATPIQLDLPENVQPPDSLTNRPPF